MGCSNPSSVSIPRITLTAVSVLILTTTATVSFLPQLSYAEMNSYFPLMFIQEEASIQDIQTCFKQKELTSKQLVKLYLKQVRKLNPTLRAVSEVNPDALAQAAEADRERKRPSNSNLNPNLGPLHGIPVLIKDFIATKDKLNTTAGSYSLLGSVVPRDAGIVARLREAGAVILGKSSMSEWANLRSVSAPESWSARAGQGLNPYNISTSPCGSSSGSAISVAANMVSVSIGTETDGSILCPASQNAVVGIKPTVGLPSRGGVIPISPRQDTIGPLCRTVADAVYVLDAIVGFDTYDAEATSDAFKYIPAGGYAQFLKNDGIRGKRLGIVRNPFFNFTRGSAKAPAFKKHLQTLRQRGAVLIDNLEIADIDTIMDFSSSGELQALLVEFKISLNRYLKGLVSSPVRSLSDVIAFNERFKDLEMVEQYGQEILLAAEYTNGMDAETKKALLKLAELSENGFEKIMTENQLDAVLTPGADFATVLAIGGYPGISVPAGYNHDGQPFEICFGALKGYEPRLIEIAYGFEQATKIRKPPPLSFLRAQI